MLKWKQTKKPTQFVCYRPKDCALSWPHEGMMIHAFVTYKPCCCSSLFYLGMKQCWTVIQKIASPPAEQDKSASIECNFQLKVSIIISKVFHGLVFCDHDQLLSSTTIKLSVDQGEALDCRNGTFTGTGFRLWDSHQQKTGRTVN